jgi:hypothetical protein
MVEVQIDDVPGSADQTLRVSFGVGLPNDMTLFPTVTLEPKFYELTANSGSSAGSVIQAKIAGVGTLDTITLIDQDGDDMCSTATVLRYEVLECHVKAKSYPTGFLVRAKDTISNTVYDCANDLDSNCQYVTTSTLEFTAVTSPS